MNQRAWGDNRPPEGQTVNDTLQMPTAPGPIVVEASWCTADGLPHGHATDSVVEANRQLLLDRSRTGIEKYRTTLAASGLSRDQLLQHLLEELLDAANYTQAVLRAPARRVVAWRYVNELGHGYAWNDGEVPHSVPSSWRIERAYSE